ncbi:tyrosine phosphatase IA-2 [Dermatophagoides farinae]|uniref:Receptor-type tyrosine-protein phosphatase n2-like protein n=1 Tax=Dermatophagoides farinae TaxID=6954 RepID=A0A922L8Q8_DERFA|nr:receptor-type tyrosine-protein phosphatase N2-like isoform X2 [Dermatophagoides farinae]KAH7639486.1 receptor-type tyrosine-protein phosphatase n2-like protein [Dermatophagoides farinae]KAH9521862.1 hypothetical protein DERF_005485 [Dermatophagoides farinae]
MLRKFVQIPFLLVIVTTTICYQTERSPSLTIKQQQPFSPQSYRDQAIGCLYSDSICSPEETCFDDHAFGRCEQYDPISGTVNSDYTYRLDRKTFQLLEQEVTRLSSQGFDWPNPYTQCILKTILNDRPRVVYNPEACDNYLPLASTTNEPTTSDDWFLEFPVLLTTTKISPQFKSEQQQQQPGSNNNLNKENLPLVIGQSQQSISSTHQPISDTNSINDRDSDDHQQLMQLSRLLAANSKHKRQPQLQDYDDQDDNINQQFVAFLKRIIQQDNLQLAKSHETNNDDLDDEDILAKLLRLNDHISYRDGQANVEEDEPHGHYSWSSFRTRSVQRTPEIRVSRDTSNDDHDDNDENIDLAALFGTLPLNEDVVVVNLDDDSDDNDRDDDQNEQKHLLINEDDDDDQDDGDLSEEDKEVLLGDINYSNNYLMPNFNRNHRHDIKKPGPIYVEQYWFQSDDQQPKSTTRQSTNLTKKNFSVQANQPVAEGPVKLDSESHDMLIIRSAEQGEHTNLEAIDSTHTYVITDKILGEEDSDRFLQTIEQVFNLPRGTFSNLRKENFQITFKVNPNYLELNASQVASRIEDMAQLIQDITGYLVKEAGIGDKNKLPVLSDKAIAQNNEQIKLITILVCSLVVSIVLIAYVLIAYVFRERIKGLMKFSGDWINFDYQDLCRQRFGQNKSSKTDVEQGKQSTDTKPISQQQQQGRDGQNSPASRSSTSSWIEEPVSSNMDITTGHIILSYMEDHLKNKSRLQHEWEALCAYEVDPCATNAALQKKNANKNRYPTILPYDHSRVILDDSANTTNSDYINANTITDHDPRNPAYIATQGPLSNTKADFWQMIWEQGSVLIVMLTRLRENGLNMCERYWPEEGSELFDNYEVHLVSEHIWCDDYLVRSFYLKNLKTGETRTVTQFHYLSWPENGVPSNIKSLLEFRRKVNKSYKGRSCPIVVHCSDGVGRTGTYILIDMVLNRLVKGAKEIDIAASLEHVRDQRMAMVKSNFQFEFVLLAVADEVQAILKALSNNN